MRHSTRILHGLIFLLIFSSVSAAQNHAKPDVPSNTEAGPNFPFEQFTIAHGLPSNDVRCILQDSQGFLWFGTAVGLARYDGYQFKVYLHDLADSTTISNNRILTLFEDHSQNLWIGTYHGLNKFDRHTETYTRYTQGPEESHGYRTSIVFAINEDGFGNPWVGYWSFNFLPMGGLYKLDRDTGKFTPYRYDPYNPNSISHNSVRCIVEDDAGALWLGTEVAGLNKFDPKTETFTRYRHDPKNPHGLGEDRVWDGVKDREGNLWFATMGGGLNKYEPGTDSFIRYIPEPNNAKNAYDWDCYKIHQDSKGMIWFPNGVLSRFDPATASFTHFRFSPNQKDWGSKYHPYAILEDNTGNLWVGTRGCGVFKIDLKPQRFTHYRYAPENPNRLSDDDIQFMIEDSKGWIWIATRGHGLSRLDPRTGQFTNFRHNPQNLRSLSNDVVYAIREDRSGIVWIGTKKGLNRFDAQQQDFTRYEHDPKNPHSLKNFAINTIFADHADTLWIGMAGDGGFCKLDRQTATFRHYSHPLNNSQHGNNIARFFEDHESNLWIETFGGLYYFDRRTGQSRFVTPNKPGIGWVDHLFEDQSHTIWGARWGLYKVNADNLSYMRYPLLESTGYPPPVGNQPGFDQTYNTIRSTYLDAKGNIWCSTDYGLYKFDPVEERVTARYYVADGLPSNCITSIKGDNAGRLWLVTAVGLSILDESAPPGKQFSNIGSDDGVINSSVTRAFIRTRSGEIYWGGTNGIYRFYPEVKATNLHRPQIRLTEFKKFNQPVKLDSSISTIRLLRLSHDENFFSLSFAAMDFTNPKQNQYAYKLEGFDEDWVQVGNKREASYTNVPPGKYTFRVKGSNNDDVWNEEVAFVKIIIAPPFWQTWWFRALIALAVFGVLAFAYNYRVSKLLEIERTRLRIARDLHDDVGSSLSSIALTAELLQKELATNGVVHRQLARVNETAQKLARNLKEIVWAIDPHRDKFDDLLLHIKEAAEELLGQKGIAYTLDVPQDELPQSLKMEFRRNLFLIYKEMLHNVVKHAEATKVEITLARSNGMLQLQVTDNGKGFRTEAPGNGNGMKSMQARAGELNGQLEIESRPERGTRVTLTVSCK